jgi:hypothetical protein
MPVDWMTAANDLGLSDAGAGAGAGAALIIIHTDSLGRTIPIENLVVLFKLNAPSRLDWAGLPRKTPQRYTCALAARDLPRCCATPTIAWSLGLPPEDFDG